MIGRMFHGLLFEGNELWLMLMNWPFVIEEDGDFLIAQPVGTRDLSIREGSREVVFAAGLVVHF